MTVIQMSDRELSRLRVMIDLGDGRLTLDAAGTLMGIGRRQVFRLCRAFEASGAPAVVALLRCCVRYDEQRDGSDGGGKDLRRNKRIGLAARTQETNHDFC
jgi:hypothetical protein